MTIPTPDEVIAWEIAYKARYKAEHTARNRAHLEAFLEDAPAMRIDRAAAYTEATVEAAEALVRADHEGIAKARGHGYGCGRLTVARENCPTYPTHDEIMAWHAGWFQGYPREVNHDPATRERGVSPPKPYFCPLCSAAEGEMHRSDCDRIADFGSHPGYPVRRPGFRGSTFT